MANRLERKWGGGGRGVERREERYGEEYVGRINGSREIGVHAWETGKMESQ